MGNFLDSTNPEPYQYRLDNKSGKGGNDEQDHLSQGVDNIAILDKLRNPALKDGFLVLTKFKDILEFISMMHYLNKHVDF